MTIRDLSSPHDFATVGDLLRSIKPDRDPLPLIEESLLPGQLSRVALIDETVVGWLWGRPLFEGTWCWELRWLVVDPLRRGQHIGEQLVSDFEAWLVARGVLACWLMTGEELGQTTLLGEDLFDRPLEKLQIIQPVGSHPYRFYERLGYQFVGVIPEANGPGVPEYLMAKRLGTTPAATP